MVYCPNGDTYCPMGPPNCQHRKRSLANDERLLFAGRKKQLCQVLDAINQKG